MTRPAPCVMVLGTSSGAGKSFLASALYRWYANRGLCVAPFKAQNMSNNARVVALPGGGHGEIGSAQYFQALAAKVAPDVRMNPVLLKPEGEMRSQVVVLGRVRHDLAAVPWRERSARLWPFAQAALQALRAEHEVVVIEGAGSPAEINLVAADFVNTSTARSSGAACLLVTDIDRGGAFAHLYGTQALMDRQVRAQLRGFVLNKFRGDPALLAPGPQQLRALTGVPTLAVVPMDPAHGLPEEDGVFHEAVPTECGLAIAVLAAPHISNLDEFEPLRRLPAGSGCTRSPTRDLRFCEFCEDEKGGWATRPPGGWSQTAPEAGATVHKPKARPQAPSFQIVSERCVETVRDIGHPEVWLTRASWKQSLPPRGPFTASQNSHNLRFNATHNVDEVRVHGASW